ncbi:MAG: DL-endopeptidase inhibitor IseA family protein [Cellulosilyticaceae bacterium]
MKLLKKRRSKWKQGSRKKKATLVLGIVVGIGSICVGCSSYNGTNQQLMDTKEVTEEQTQPKEEVPSITDEEMIDLVADAEDAVEEILYGIDYDQESSIENYGVAIEQFNGKEKIIEHLSTYWVDTYAEAFIDIYGIKFENGKTYIPIGDGTSPKYREGKVVSNKEKGKEREIIIDCPSGYDENEVSTEKRTLIYENNKWVVKDRGK